MNAPLIIDSFAGGGGASEGIEQALRILKAMGALPPDAPEHVDYAVNHDDAALAMHAANHPRTIHLPHNVWKVSLRDLVGPRAVDLLWLSPDCRHHSRAKGSAPVSRSVRDLAWVAMRWLKELRPVQRPRRIFLENVREFQDWGPLVPDATGRERPDSARKGETFRAWVKDLHRLGYRRIEWRELRACDYGIPTRRLRLYMVASLDAEPIVWPAPTHGDPRSEAVREGLLRPWPIAADCIDWDRPCPSIFLTRDEARAHAAATGTRIVRPLAPNTDARIAKGVKRYVLDAAEPFIVTCNHGGDGFRGQAVADPFATVTSARDAHGLVAPILVTNTSGHPGSGVDAPLPTVTTGGHHIAVAPHLVSVNHGDSGGRREYGADEPLGTVTPSRSRELAAIFLGQHNTRDVGRAAADPLSTATGTGGHQGVVAAHMLSLKGSERRAMDAAEPHATVCGGGQQSAVVALPMLSAYYRTGEGQALDTPARTATVKDRFALVDGEGRVPPLSEAQAARARQVADFLRRHGCWDDREFVTVGPWIVVDIGMRMLTARELARANGLPEGYVLAAPYKGGTLSDTEQRHKIGNCVCPGMATALVVANHPAAQRSVSKRRPPRPAREIAPAPLFAAE